MNDTDTDNIESAPQTTEIFVYTATHRKTGEMGVAIEMKYNNSDDTVVIVISDAASFMSLVGMMLETANMVWPEEIRKMKDEDNHGAWFEGFTGDEVIQ